MERTIVGNLFLEAAKHRLESQIKDARAKVNLYLTQAVGVGEHPEITEEIIKAAEQGAHAQDVLDFIDEYWN
tara:strand:+ start:3456 stop:3671 length:216 start_codon:yes stop_codon:yes gene_type:complete